MRRFIALAVGSFLSASLAAAVCAAPAGTADRPKPNQGMQNAKKAMMSKLERDKKVHEIRKVAQAKRQQAQRGK